jgi:hypothetical protein
VPVVLDLTVVKIGVLLERQGVAVPYRTLHRFCAERCGYGRAGATTVRVADGEPGAECQLDFGYLGLIADPVTGRQRKVHALIFTACYSRHMFVWLSFTQTLAAFTAGCEAAWAFFGGVITAVLDLQDRPNVAARVSRRQDLDEWLGRSPLIETVFDDEELRTASAQRNTAT